MMPFLADLSARLWRSLRGVWQWYALWLVHSKFIVGVSGIIRNDRDEILLLRHRYWTVGIWGLPGGYVRAGETMETALMREVQEETGLQIEVESLLKLVSGYRLRLEVHYLGRVQSGLLQADPTEVLEARFFPIDALPEGLLPNNRRLIEETLLK